MIEGVALKKLTTHEDARGFFREIIRVNDEIFKEGFGQWSHSMMRKDVIKAWHIHNLQTDWWYVPKGVLRVALYDNRADSPTYKELMELVMGDGHDAVILRVPPGVAHGCKCIKGPTHLLYVTSKVYNPQDEGRIPFDDREIGYNWQI